MNPTPPQVAEALSAYTPMELPALPGRTNHLKAGVMIPIVWDPEPRVLLTLRPQTMRRHGGEVCFPGGRPEAADEDLWDTACREAKEELGIQGARCLGLLTAMPVYTSDFRLFPHVAEVPAGPLVPDPEEVAEVLPVAFATLYGLPHIDGIPYGGHGVMDHSPVFMVGGSPVFGATAHSLWELLYVLAPVFGCELPPFQAGRWRWQDLLVVPRRRG